MTEFGCCDWWPAKHGNYSISKYIQKCIEVDICVNREHLKLSSNLAHFQIDEYNMEVLQVIVGFILP